MSRRPGHILPCWTVPLCMCVSVKLACEKDKKYITLDLSDEQYNTSEVLFL